eukprot:gene165-29_t
MKVMSKLIAMSALIAPVYGISLQSDSAHSHLSVSSGFSKVLAIYVGPLHPEWTVGLKNEVGQLYGNWTVGINNDDSLVLGMANFEFEVTEENGIFKVSDRRNTIWTTPDLRGYRSENWVAPVILTFLAEGGGCEPLVWHKTSRSKIKTDSIYDESGNAYLGWRATALAAPPAQAPVESLSSVLVGDAELANDCKKMMDKVLKTLKEGVAFTSEAPDLPSMVSPDADWSGFAPWLLSRVQAVNALGGPRMRVVWHGTLTHLGKIPRWPDESGHILDLAALCDHWIARQDAQGKVDGRGFCVYFFSHNWERPFANPSECHPDNPNHAKARALARYGANGFCPIFAPHHDFEYYFFIDYAGIDQVDRREKWLGVSKLPAYVSSCVEMVFYFNEKYETGAWTRMERCLAYVFMISPLFVFMNKDYHSVSDPIHIDDLINDLVHENSAFIKDPQTGGLLIEVRDPLASDAIESADRQFIKQLLDVVSQSTPLCPLMKMAMSAAHPDGIASDTAGSYLRFDGQTYMPVDTEHWKVDCERKESTQPKISEDKNKNKKQMSPITLKSNNLMMLSDSEVAKNGAVMSEKYEIIQELGEGSFGKVFLVRLVHDASKIYALKEFKILRKGKKIRTNRALEEATILSQLTHANIVHHKDVFVSGGLFYLVMEYAEKGDLGEQIEMRIEKGRTWKKAFIIHWFAQIVSGLAYLHSHNIIHRDIKPGNILVAKNFVLKIADFGLARQMEGSEIYANTQCGTRLYMCPEAMLQDDYSYSADVWAMGCVLYNLCLLKRPFEIIRTILKGPIPEIPHTLNGEDTQDLAIICNKMLVRDPKQRICCQDLDNLFQKSQKSEQGGLESASEKGSTTSIRASGTVTSYSSQDKTNSSSNPSSEHNSNTSTFHVKKDTNSKLFLGQSDMTSAFGARESESMELPDRSTRVEINLSRLPIGAGAHAKHHSGASTYSYVSNPLGDTFTENLFDYKQIPNDGSFVDLVRMTTCCNRRLSKRTLILGGLCVGAAGVVLIVLVLRSFGWVL